MPTKHLAEINSATGDVRREWYAQVADDVADKVVAPRLAPGCEWIDVLHNGRGYGALAGGRYDAATKSWTLAPSPVSLPSVPSAQERLNDISAAVQSLTAIVEKLAAQTGPAKATVAKKKGT